MGLGHGGRVLSGPRGTRPLRAAATSLSGVLHNRDIRNLELGWTIGTAADWALLVVALLVAYETGGAVLVGLVSLFRMIPATLVNVLVDPGRFRRPERALVAVNLVRAAGCGTAAAGIVLALPVLVFLAVAVTAAAGALTRPSMLALLPAAATTPEELVSANVTTALGEGLGTFAGPLLAGLAAAASGQAGAALLAAVLCVIAALVVHRVQVADAARPAHGEGHGGIPLIGGIRQLARHPPAAAVTMSFIAQTAVRGALTTYLAVLAIEVLGMGEGGVGVLGAAIGMGGLAGAFLALALGTRPRLATTHAAALALWGLPIALIGAAPSVPVALGALAVVGVANALLDVAGDTLLQRGIPNRARSAVFSIVEVGVGIGGSIGGLLGVVLLDRLGIDLALVATGLALPVVALLTWPFSRRLEDRAVVPEHRAALLRGIPLFRPLPLSALERLASGMREAQFAAGERLMTEGEAGDRYVIIETGEVEVSAGGTVLGREGGGSGLGEIALLRAVPRTATVTAVGEVVGWVIDSGTFVAAVTGHGGSSTAAEAVVDERLRRGAAGPG